jgi:eukaryotic-like serine/threonine-protein kinase
MTATSTRPISIATAAPVRQQGDSPSRMGAWSLLGLLARGSVADLYLAQAADQSASKTQRYVVKVLRPEWREHSLVRQQFSTEAALGRQLKSPHLPAVLHSDMQADGPYMVLPLIEGQTVAALMRRQSMMPLALKLAILRQTALGLAALHAADYLHGDLKPENLLLSPSGHLTLIDLGSARPIRESGSIWNRPVLGSPAYLAPELFTSSMPGDARSDLYSLGVIGYELLAERHPYPHATVEDYATAAKQTRPAALRQLAPQLPTTITELIDSLLAKQPSRRPDSAAVVIARLLSAELSAWQSWASSS